MSEQVNPTAEEIAAAHLRLALDRRLGKPTAPIITKLTRTAPDPIPGTAVSAPGTADPIPRIPDPHLLPDAVVAFAEGELSPAARERAAGHLARCSLCAAEVAVQRQAGAAIRGSAEPAEEQHDLTVREQQVLAMIADSVDRRGYPPSLREIGEGVGLTSVSSVARVLKALELKGRLRRNSSSPRSVGTPVSDVDSPAGQ